MLDKADEELSGVISTAATCLQLYLDPLVARATSASDFALRDLVDGPVPVSLYLVVPPSDLSRTRPLVRLMLNQLTRRLVESMEFEEGRTKLPTLSLGPASRCWIAVTQTLFDSLTANPRAIIASSRLVEGFVARVKSRRLRLLSPST